MRLILCTLIVRFVRALRGAEAGQRIDLVWSGHPVGFAFLTERGHPFIAYFDADRRITVMGRNRDQAREVNPPPSELRLFELPEAELTGSIG